MSGTFGGVYSAVVPYERRFHVKLMWHSYSNHMSVERIYPTDDTSRLLPVDRKFLAMARAAFEIDVEILQGHIVGGPYDNHTKNFISEWAFRTEKFLRDQCRVDAKIELELF